MNERKLIAIDIDGTLLDSNYNISDGLLQVFSKIKEQNLIVLTTGRPLRSTLPIYQKIGLTSPMILYNGQSIYWPSHPEIRWKIRFPISLVEGLYEALLPCAFSFMAEDGDTLLLNGNDTNLLHYFPLINGKYVEGKPKEILHHDAWTCLFRSDPQTDAAAEKFLCNSHQQTIKIRAWTGEPYKELYDIRANKGAALSYLASKLGFARNDILAVGDSLNDKEMLELAGSSFLMKNCKNEDLRKKFPLTKKGNNEDGLRILLEEYFSL